MQGVTAAREWNGVGSGKSNWTHSVRFPGNEEVVVLNTDQADRMTATGELRQRK